MSEQDGLWLADARGQLLECNDALRRWWSNNGASPGDSASGAVSPCGRRLDELGWSPEGWPPVNKRERRWRRLALREGETPVWVQETVIPVKRGLYLGWWQRLQEPMSRSGLTIFAAQGTRVILNVGPRLLQARGVDEVLTFIGEMAQALCEAPGVEIFMRRGREGYRSVWRRGSPQPGLTAQPGLLDDLLTASMRAARVWTADQFPPKLRALAQSVGLTSMALWTVRLSPQWEIAIACYNPPERVPACWDALPHAWFVHLSALALQRAWEAERARRRLAMIQTWRIIETSISSRLSCQEIAEIFVQEVMLRLGFDAVAVTFWAEAPAPCQAMHREAGFPKPDCLAKRDASFWERHPIGRQVRQERRIYLDAGWDPHAQPLPAECGYDFKGYVAVPLLAQDRFWGVLELFSRQPFLDPDEIETLAQALGAQFAIALDNAHLLNELRKALKEVSEAYDRTIEGWVQMLDMRDEETEGHTQRVARMAVALAKEMNFSDEELQHVRRGALLHDIGKISIPDRILRKPGPLTAEEWEIMRQHPERAYEILSSIEYLRPALDIPYAHHERWDGSGYPRGLKGKEIPLPARLFAVVDVYDALTSDRPYRKAWPQEKALKFIESKAGKWFDPDVVRVFLKLVREKKHPAFQPASSGALGSEERDAVHPTHPEIQQPVDHL
ncbi:MAG: HD domain-containing protein [Chloroflexi bacterium]|nr:HD domain-containing protein [Chloroflexota bacterium]